MNQNHAAEKCVLIGDDNPSDFFLVKKALHECGGDICLEWVRDGEQVLKHLEGEHRPKIILLDLHMPKLDGLETLKEIKSLPHFSHIPIVVLTTSRYDQAILEAYRCGASSYICKPASYTGLKESMAALRKYWFEAVSLPETRKRAG